MSDSISTPPSAVNRATIERLQAVAKAAVSALLVLVDPARTAERAAFFRSLRPLPGDYARVFVEAALPPAQAFYEAMWSQPLEMSWNLRQTELQVAVALADDFAEWNERAAPFPNGYRDIAELFQPGIPWLCWKMTAPGELYGLSADGLVQLDDRLVWFPRPFIALTTPLPGEAGQ